MSEQVKTKIELNKVTHSVRAAQAVLQYGVGAMVDFSDQTLVTAAPEYSLNLAACHACGLLPETCCEERNAFLDRGVIVGTYESPEIGFWNDID